MTDFNEIIYIKTGEPRSILIDSSIREYIVAEINVKLKEKKHKKILIDYCVNVNANTVSPFRTLNIRLYKIRENFDPEPIGSSRNIVISATISNIQSFFLCDEEDFSDKFKYIAVVENTQTLATGVAILNNSNLKVTIY